MKAYYFYNKVNKYSHNALVYCDLLGVINLNFGFKVYFIVITNFENIDYYYKINMNFFEDFKNSNSVSSGGKGSFNSYTSDKLFIS